MERFRSIAEILGTRLDASTKNNSQPGINAIVMK